VALQLQYPPHRKLWLHYEGQLVDDVYGNRFFFFFCQNYTKNIINALCGKNIEFIDVTAGGRYSYHHTLKG
jgi:hypothetical protein